MNDEPQWIINTEEMGTIGLWFLIVFALPFIPPFMIGVEIGKAINDINLMKLGGGGLFAVLWYLVLKKVHVEKGKAGLIALLLLEALAFDGYTAYKSHKTMVSITLLQQASTWARSK